MAVLDSQLAAKIRCSPEGCWEWLASRSDGYGRVTWQGRQRPAHRVVYELLVGPIPAGLQIDHLCRNRGCVNPAHLEPVTQRENLMRGETIPARHAAQTHCGRGHIFDEANTYVRKDGRRSCRACDAARCRAAYQPRVRKKAAT